jgi:predicted small metal-binding protein
VTKVLRCRDVGLDCDFIARGESEADVLEQAARHAHLDHGMVQIPDELVAAALSVIADE